MRKRPIGQILVEKEEISEADLAAALAEQERSGRRLGEILIEQGRISWLALARAIAEQVLDIQGKPAEPEATAPEPTPPEDPLQLIRALAERVANLPPVPESAPSLPLPVEVAPPAEPVATLDPPPAPEHTHVLRLTPAKQDSLLDPELKLHSIEALLKERQRAFIELVTTTETLRMKVAHLEEILEERDRELTKLRVLRAS
jgi:hypothetical protein